MTHDESFEAAVQTFLIEPEALTPDQIDVLKNVDDRLSDRAIAKRAEALQKAAEARHRAALGQPAAATKSDAEDLADVTLDTITLFLAKPRARIKALELSNTVLEQRCQALESRLLELEAQRAIAHVDR